MTDNQKIFVNEYLIDLNATRAYKAAYPKVKNDNTAGASAARLLRDAKIAEYIKERMAERAKRTEVTQDDVVKELAKIGFAQITDYIAVNNYGRVIIKPTAELEENKVGAIAGIKESSYGIEIKMNDKVKALELLGRHLGMFTDKQEIKAKVSIEDYLERLGGDYEY